MSFNTITVETDARGVARLTLSRPAKHNVLSGEMCDELAAAAAGLGADAGVRVVVLTGAGRASAPAAISTGCGRSSPPPATGAWPRRGGWRECSGR